MNKYKITSLHEVFEDNFLNGETSFVNSWEQNKIVKATNLNEALKIYFNNEIYINYDIEKLDIDNDMIFTSNLCDINNFWANEAQIEKWKKNEIKLFSQHITIYAEIMQRVNIEQEFLTIN